MPAIQGDRTPLLPQHETTTPEPYASASGYHGLQLSGYSRSRRMRNWAKGVLAAILAFAMIFLLRWSWHSKGGSPDRSHSPLLPPDEGTIEQLAHWSPVQRVSDGLPSKPYRRTAHLELQTSNFFAHSYGTRHSTRWSFSGPQSGSQGKIKIELEQRAKEAWVLNNTIKIVTLRSHGKGGIGVYSDPHHHQGDWQYKVDVMVYAHFPDSDGKFERLEVRSEAGSVHFRDLGAQIDVVDVQSGLGSIYFDGSIPNTSTIDLKSDAGSIHIITPIFTNKLLSTSRSGSVNWNQAHATEFVHAQSDSGSIRTKFIHAPKAVLTSDVGAITIGTAVVQDLEAVTHAGGARVSSLVPSMFAQKDKSDAAHVLVRTTQGSVHVELDDHYDQDPRDVPTTLAPRVHSTFTSDSGSVRIRYAPSFAGTVNAKTEVGSVHLGSQPAGKQWAWTHHKTVVGEAYQGCVYSKEGKEGKATKVTMVHGNDLDWPEQCKHAHVPSDSVVHSNVGSVNLSF